MKRWLIGLGVVLLSGALVVPAMAGPGWARGWGGHMMGPGYGSMMGPGYGGHMAAPGYGPMMGPGFGYCPGYGGRMGYGPYAWGPGYPGRLSSEEAAKLEELRQAHWADIRPLREDLFNKQQELWNLNAQTKPDKEAVDRLAKEVFDLRQKLREKDFAFRRQVAELVPGYGGSYGYGPGRGRWGGPGPYAGWCWND
jgi:Spy/CpxP family protein refolding chaperone